MALSNRPAGVTTTEASASSEAEGESTRITGSILGFIERPLLRRLALAMPAWVTPDKLTAVGLAGAGLTALSYALSNRAPEFLWLASAGLIVNWYGDSLDGTLARVRRIERPRYGFLVDHTTDVAAQVLVGIGLGLSPFIRFDTACIGLIVYLCFSIFTFVKTFASGKLQIAFGGVGPTEVRCGLVVLNIFLFWQRPAPVLVLWEPLSVVDLGALAMSAFALIALIVAAAREVRRVALLDPSP